MQMDLEAAVHRYGNAILKYCYGILCDYHEAQDARQETFIKAYAKRAAYEDQGVMGAWLYKIAYRTCLNMLRKKRFMPWGGEAQKEASYEMGDDLVSHDIKAALSFLPPKDRALVYSRAVEGMDYNQLESLYGTSAATLRKRYERAKKKLEARLSEAGYP